MYKNNVFLQLTLYLMLYVSYSVLCVAITPFLYVISCM